MTYALRLAECAARQGEVPVGAVLVADDKLVAEGWNQPIASHDATAHAEIQVIRRAGVRLRNYRLPRTTLYVTLEPCAMCVGAIVHARIGRLVFAAADAKAGAVVSRLSLLNASHFNHKVEWQGGIMAETCSQLLTQFFRSRRSALTAKNQ